MFRVIGCKVCCVSRCFFLVELMVLSMIVVGVLLLWCLRKSEFGSVWFVLSNFGCCGVIRNNWLLLCVSFILMLGVQCIDLRMCLNFFGLSVVLMRLVNLFCGLCIMCIMFMLKILSVVLNGVLIQRVLICGFFSICWKQLCLLKFLLSSGF